MRGKQRLTAFGKWIKAQPRGVLSECARRTRISWSTVSYAQRKRVTVEIAELLSGFTDGQVAVDDIRIPARRPAEGP